VSKAACVHAEHVIMIVLIIICFLSFGLLTIFLAPVIVLIKYFSFVQMISDSLIFISYDYIPSYILL
jgi:hypothetical protein